jgi:putative Holliday junction resolvase
MKYLGVDFGGKRVGIAVSDDTGKLAFPFCVINNDKNLLTEIKKMIDKEKVNQIVIGESKDFKNKPNEIMWKIEKFKKELTEKFGIKVFFEPEFMTSVQAKQIQGENEMHDASAAAIILQSYLDKNSGML